VSDLLSCDAVYHDSDLLCWLPRARYTRTEARARFWRETNSATWDVAWTNIRVVARYVRLADDRHPDEGHYVQCDAGAPGATPVWRCETLGRDGKPMPETTLSGRLVA
jgi:hypothetical protein